MYEKYYKLRIKSYEVCVNLKHCVKLLLTLESLMKHDEEERENYMNIEKLYKQTNILYMENHRQLHHVIFAPFLMSAEMCIRRNFSVRMDLASDQDFMIFIFPCEKKEKTMIINTASKRQVTFSCLEIARCDFLLSWDSYAIIIL